MRVASREALGRAEAKWQELSSQVPDILVAAQEMFAALETVESSERLRNSLTDPAFDAEAKSNLARQVFATQLSDAVTDLLALMAADRWSHSRDFPESLELMAVIIALGEAGRNGNLEVVEDEVFRLSRLVARNEELQTFLSRYDLPAAQRAMGLRQLLEGKAAPTTIMLAGKAAERASRHRGAAAFLRQVGNLAAQQRHSLVASVTAAIRPSQAQLNRLTKILEKRFEKPVRVHISLDASVIGGIRVRIGDRVFDGTVATRLHQARQRVTVNKY